MIALLRLPDLYSLIAEMILSSGVPANAGADELPSPAGPWHPAQGAAFTFPA
jgi:hypothetical protein